MTLALTLALSLTVTPVVAQQQAADLQFPSEISEFGLFTSPHMAIYKPKGAGPFPALVLLHQCGGLGAGNWRNESMLEWARQAVTRGYVAMLVDSLGPRGVDTVCLGAKGGVTFARGARDALQAAEHLQKFDFVDARRIALAGYSWGAMVGVFGNSTQRSSSLLPNVRFAATVSFYPGCFRVGPANSSYEIVAPDIDRPLLVMMGELDNETPAEECIAKLGKVKEGGAPIEWHVYPKTTHCWDCRNLDGRSKVDFRGNTIVYRYSKEVTDDSAQRMFGFLDRIMGSRPPVQPSQ